MKIKYLFSCILIILSLYGCKDAGQRKDLVRKFGYDVLVQKNTGAAGYLYDIIDAKREINSENTVIARFLFCFGDLSKVDSIIIEIGREDE